MQFFLAAFVVISGLEPVQRSNEVLASIVTKDPLKIQQDFFRLFDSIGKNDSKTKETYQSILREETRMEQQAFDSAKDEFRSVRFRSSKPRQSHAVLKRGEKITSAEVPELPGQRELTRLPKTSLGCSSLVAIKEKKAVYIDRTKMAYDLIMEKNIFLFMRPRRFGKSLLLNVFKTILRHDEQDLGLLQGTYVENLVRELPAHAVLEFNFQNLRTIDGLDAAMWEHAYSYNVLDKYEKALNDALDLQERRQRNEGKTDKNKKPIQTFPILMNALKEPIAVLVDEYNIVFHSEVDEKTREYFFEFFLSLKKFHNNHILRFAFITGCDKVKLKLPGYYHLNAGLGTTIGINDISDSLEYAHLLGFTEEEIRTNYNPLVERKATKTGKTVDEVYAQIKLRYDGYHFGDHTTPAVYNPVSVMKYLEDLRSFEGRNYWSETVPDSPNVIRKLIEAGNLIDLEKKVIDLDAYYTKEELYDKEIRPTLMDESYRSGLEATLFRHGYLTTRELVGDKRLLRFPNTEAIEAFADAVENAMAKTKEGIELGRTAWRSLDKGDMKGFAEAFNQFIKYPAYQQMMKIVTKELEAFHKNFIEIMMSVGKCDSCKVHREESMTETTKGKLKMSRPDFIFDTEDKRIYAEFKYKSGKPEFKTDYFEQYRRYKFYTCKVRHPKGREAIKMKILINLEERGIAQWYGPKTYRFESDAEEDQQSAKETYDEKYEGQLWDFPRCTKCKPELYLDRGDYDSHIKGNVHRPCACGRSCGEQRGNFGGLATHMKHCEVRNAPPNNT